MSSTVLHDRVMSPMKVCSSPYTEAEAVEIGEVLLRNCDTAASLHPS